MQEEAIWKRPARFAWHYDDRLLVEQFIAGRELTVGIFDGQALPVVEIRPEARFFHVRGEVHEGGRRIIWCPRRWTRASKPASKMLALRAHDCLGCRDCFARGFDPGGKRRIIRAGSEHDPGVHRNEPRAAKRRGRRGLRFRICARAWCRWRWRGANRSRSRGRRGDDRGFDEAGQSKKKRPGIPAGREGADARTRVGAAAG